MSACPSSLSHLPLVPWRALTRLLNYLPVTSNYRFEWPAEAGGPVDVHLRHPLSLFPLSTLARVARVARVSTLPWAPGRRGNLLTPVLTFRRQVFDSDPFALMDLSRTIARVMIVIWIWI